MPKSFQVEHLGELGGEQVGWWGRSHRLALGQDQYDRPSRHPSH